MIQLVLQGSHVWAAIPRWNIFQPAAPRQAEDVFESHEQLRRAYKRSLCLGLPSLFACHFFCAVGLRDVLSSVRHILNAQDSIILTLKYCKGTATVSLKAEGILESALVCLPSQDLLGWFTPSLQCWSCFPQLNNTFKSLSYRSPRTRKKSKGNINIQATGILFRFLEVNWVCKDTSPQKHPLQSDS